MTTAKGSRKDDRSHARKNMQRSVATFWRSRFQELLTLLNPDVSFFQSRFCLESDFLPVIIILVYHLFYQLFIKCFYQSKKKH